MRLLAASMIAALAACTPQAGERAPPAARTQAAVPETTTPSPLEESGLVPVASLAGEWRIAGIDGKDFNEPYGLALTGSAQELWWEPRCAGIARSYRIKGLAVEFGPALGAPAPGAAPQPVCAIGLPPRIEEVTRALDAANKVGRTPSNGIEISGGGHSVLLFSQ